MGINIYFEEDTEPAILIELRESIDIVRLVFQFLDWPFVYEMRLPFAVLGFDFLFF